jgi:hypothetical protein
LSINFWVRIITHPIIKKRNKEVKKISAGDRVKFQIEKKPAEEGEKIDRDWIFSKFASKKKINLSPANMRMINNPGKNFRSMEKEGDVTREMSRNIREKPRTI